MKKKNLALIMILIFMQVASVVLAANWPNMTTSTTTVSNSTSSGGSGYVVSAGSSRTRYKLSYKDGALIKTYVDTSGLNGNTCTWFNLKNGIVSGVSNPHITVGDELFTALLGKANKEAMDVIKEGKSQFVIEAEILVNYAPKNNTKAREYLSYREASEKGWISGSYSKLLWSIACAELRKW